jgi:hypothetical protein
MLRLLLLLPLSSQLTCVMLTAERGPDVRMCADPEDARWVHAALDSLSFYYASNTGLLLCLQVALFE